MRDLILPVLVTVCCLGAYHWLFARDQGGTEAPDRNVPTDLGARIAALEARGAPEGRPELTSGVLERRLETLEARLDALAAGAHAPARPAGEDRPQPGDADYVWDDGALDWLQAAIRAVRHRDLRERQEKRYHALLARLAPEASAQRREEGVALIMDMHDDARRIYPEGSAGSTPQEREEAARQLALRRADLQRGLRALFGDDLAAKILSSVPGAARPPGGVRSPIGSDK